MGCEILTVFRASSVCIFVLTSQDQLEAFQLEKTLLLGQTQNVQIDLEKLSREYARLLGHQNQKQKIKHVLKLKEDNNALKTVRVCVFCRCALL